jgi:hypothetical protein
MSYLCAGAAFKTVSNTVDPRAFISHINKGVSKPVADLMRELDPDQT